MTEVWVTVLRIEHRHGTDVTVHSTEAGADKWLADYCREWWEPQYMGDMPEGVWDMIDVYFEQTENEFYETTTARILP